MANNHEYFGSWVLQREWAGVKHSLLTIEDFLTWSRKAAYQYKLNKVCGWVIVKTGYNLVFAVLYITTRFIFFAVVPKCQKSLETQNFLQTWASTPHLLLQGPTTNVVIHIMCSLSFPFSLHLFLSNNVVRICRSYCLFKKMCLHLRQENNLSLPLLRLFSVLSAADKTQ